MDNIELFDGERIDAVNEKITLIQKKDGLTFGTDAFLLASFIKPRQYGRAAELGAGTGIISLLLAARDKFDKITAFEVQEDFASLALRNVKLNRLDGKIDVIHRDVREILPNEFGEFDAVFANPPYMKIDSGKRNESDYKFIARHEVCGEIEDFCASAFKLLKHGGKFYAVWRPDRLCDLLVAMRSHRLEPKLMTFVASDTESRPSMVLVSATKGGSSGMEVTAPLILYDAGQNQKLSEKARKIYDTLSFD